MEGTIIIKLNPGDKTEDILQIFQSSEAQKFYFDCPRNYPVLSDIAFLKKIKESEGEHKKEAYFIVSQEVIRTILKSQNIKVLQALPEALENEESFRIADLMGKIAAQKNIYETKPASASGAEQNAQKGDLPAFSTRRIENTEKNEKPVRGYIFFAFLLVLSTLVGIFFWISPSAYIVIKPKISAIPVTQNVLVKFHEAEIPEENENLPQIQGIYMETIIEGEEVFPSTRKEYDLTNARGKITIYNNTDEPKFFIPSRLSTQTGVIFRFQNNITVPPRNGDVPGELVVEIIADEYDEAEEPIGNRGNIDAGTELFFPALRAETREDYWGKANKGPLVGGSTLTHHFVQESDFEGARKMLEDTFRFRATEKLKEEIALRSKREQKKYILVDDPRLMQSEFLEINFPEELVGQEIQTFAVKAQIKLSGVVFDQDAVMGDLREKIEASQDHRKKLLSLDQNSLDYRVLNFEEFEANKWLKLSISMTGVETLNFDASNKNASEWKQNLRKEIAGRPILEVRGLLTNHPEIEEVRNLKVTPFWAENLPRIFEQIEFEIYYE